MVYCIVAFAESHISGDRIRLGCAGIAQLVEHKLPKLGVAGSNPVARSSKFPRSRHGSLFEVVIYLQGW